MSLLLRLAATVLAAATLTGCGGDDGAAADRSFPVVPPSSSSAPAPDDLPEQSEATSACEEVVAGIDAFNDGDLEETVAAFERAVPLAEAEDAAAGTRASADLLEAVEYYATLPIEDYAEASVASFDFAKYKAITLGQCASDQPPAPGGSGEGGGIPA